MTINIHEMSIDDYQEIYNLWEKSDNIGLSKADSLHSIGIFLQRNPGMSYTAWAEGKLVEPYYAAMTAGGAIFTI